MLVRQDPPLFRASARSAKAGDFTVVPPPVSLAKPHQRRRVSQPPKKPPKKYIHDQEVTTEYNCNVNPSSM